MPPRVPTAGTPLRVPRRPATPAGTPPRLPRRPARHPGTSTGNDATRGLDTEMSPWGAQNDEIRRPAGQRRPIWDQMSLWGARNDEIRELARASVPDGQAMSSVSAPWGAKASRPAIGSAPGTPPGTRSRPATHVGPAPASWARTHMHRTDHGMACPRRRLHAGANGAGRAPAAIYWAAASKPASSPGSAARAAGTTGRGG